LPHRSRTVSEVLRFFAIAFGATAVLHGSIAALGLSFSLSLSSPVLWLYLLGLATPAAAAIGLSGSPSVGPLLRSALQPASLAVCGSALLAQASLLAAAALLAYAKGGSDFPRWSVAGDFSLLALGQVWVVLGEELGWRGYALPRLLRLASARIATWLLALAWAVWHAPMFFVSGSLQAREPVWLFAAAVFAWACIHSALYLRARPSILPNLLFHASANLTLNLITLPQSAQSTLACVYLVAGVVVWSRLGSASPSAVGRRS
jgi:membrane protease YdiL (CAAX protease family)